MSVKSFISKEVFVPCDERLLGIVQVKRRMGKKIPFLATGGLGDYKTYICLSVRNKRPSLRFITKVKHFEGSGTFVRRSQWALEQLRQVNGECPEFDLLFDNAYDLWVASSSPSFVNCQAQIIGGNSILHTAADSVTSAVQKASQALNERGERLGRADQRTAEMANSAHKFAETAHKVTCNNHH
uniref:Syntaxin binding protein 6 n=1 Tax=Eptatretus burgeri TaxID=7764 RepID=A0A8C4NE11_EPTBU